jgi:hypothetical protein
MRLAMSHDSMYVGDRNRVRGGSSHVWSRPVEPSAISVDVEARSTFRDCEDWSALQSSR